MFSVPNELYLFVANRLTIARAYFLSGSYDKAEAALDELIPSVDSSTDHVRLLSDYHPN